MIKTQFNSHVKVVRSDNGTEFLNSQCSDLFNHLGILHQSSCPHTPQQNGVVERKHRHILNIARAIRFQAHLPIRFWGYCIKAAVYLINRLPSSVNFNKSAYELLYCKQPSLSHLKVIGCLCYATTMPKGDKFSARASAAILLGYSELQKGYVLLDIHSTKVHVNRDVVFHEEIFPFAKVRPQLDPLVDIHCSPLEKAENQTIEAEIDNSEHADTSIVHEDSQSNETENSSEDQMSRPSTTEEVSENTHAIPSHVDSYVRRSSRSIKEPMWMKDYVITKGHSSTKHPMENYLNYEKLKPECRSFLSKLSEYTEPKNFNQASQDERWIQAMKQEIKALEENNTWQVV